MNWNSYCITAAIRIIGGEAGHWRGASLCDRSLESMEAVIHAICQAWGIALSLNFAYSEIQFYCIVSDKIL